MDDFFVRFVRRACQQKKRRPEPGGKWQLPITKISNMLFISARMESCSLHIPFPCTHTSVLLRKSEQSDSFHLHVSGWTDLKQSKAIFQSRMGLRVRRAC